MRGLVSLAALACMSCGWTRGDADRDNPSCRLEQAVEIARPASVRLDGIALAPAEAGALVVWSESAGTYARNVEATGKPRGAPWRVGERCQGGLDLAAIRDSSTAPVTGHWLACSRPSPVPEQAELARFRLDATGRIESQELVGLVGRDGAGVSLAVDGSRVLVAWHDGTVQGYAARLMIDSQGQREYVTLSDPSFAAGAPSIVARDGHWIAAFSETHIGVDQTATRVMLRSDRHPARALCETDEADPAPIVGWDDTSPWIAYRDRRARAPKPELFTTRLGTRLTTSGSSHQIGRANSEGAPSLLICDTLRLALLPRDYASERFIGVHALDAALQNLQSGHQYYANSRDFVLARGACLGSSALIVTAERKAPADPGASLMAMSFHCAADARQSADNTPAAKR